MSLNEFWKKWRGAWINSVRRRGIARTVTRAIVQGIFFPVQQWKRYSTLSPWNPWYCYLDERFDRRFAVDTAGVLILPEIHSDRRFNGYSPTPHSFFARLLHQMDIDYSKFTFIDFGCGKGKVLFLAAEHPFKQIIGIELSSKLFQIAGNNLKTYRGEKSCKTIQLVQADARTFHLPEECSVYYFCDPFEAELMQPVLQNIRTSLAAAPREIYILYYMPVHRRLFDKSGFLKLVKEASWYCVYKGSEVRSPE